MSFIQLLPASIFQKAEQAGICWSFSAAGVEILLTLSDWGCQKVGLMHQVEVSLPCVTPDKCFSFRYFNTFGFDLGLVLNDFCSHLPSIIKGIHAINKLALKKNICTLQITHRFHFWCSSTIRAYAEQSHDRSWQHCIDTRTRNINILICLQNLNILDFEKYYKQESSSHAPCSWENRTIGSAEKHRTRFAWQSSVTGVKAGQ